MVTMLCIRDPDSENEYVFDTSDVRQVEIDIGGDWNGYKHFCRELAVEDTYAREYEQKVMEEVADLAPDNPVRVRVEEFFEQARNQG